MKKNNEVNQDNIFDIIISLMVRAENRKHLSGKSKKDLVMDLMRSELGSEIYDRYKPFINASIEFIINISKGMKIKLINKKCFCFNLCKK